MRIISGIAGGIRLESPKDSTVRPTTDRVKESIFGVLGDLRDTKVLDLFAGSGALGLEALSRGAARVTFVEKSIRHVQLIERNLSAVKKAMGQQFTDAQVIRGDAAAVERLPGVEPGTYDFILADPPYHSPFGPNELITSNGFCAVAGKAIVAIEHDRGVKPAATPASGWRLLKSSAFGTTVVSYLRQR